MPVSRTDELRPEVQAQVDAYLATIRAGLCRVAAPLADELTAETSSHLLDVLSADSTLAGVELAIADLGPADEYAAAMCAEISGGKPQLREAAGALPDVGGPGTGRVLGMPYDVRMPTTERIRLRWWNPTDPRIWMPRAWGIGWDLNFGALAVKLRLIRPDDQDEPFAHVPEAWIYLALAVPLLITAAMAGAWALMAATLPELLPVHWGISGQADRYAEPPTALGFLLVMALVPTVWALVSFVMHRSKAARVLVTSFATLFASLAGAIFLITVTWPAAEGLGWLLPVAILSALLVPFGMLVVLARIDRREAWERDLARGRRDGSSYLSEQGRD